MASGVSAWKGRGLTSSARRIAVLSASVDGRAGNSFRPVTGTPLPCPLSVYSRCNGGVYAATKTTRQPQAMTRRLHIRKRHGNYKRGGLRAGKFYGPPLDVARRFRSMYSNPRSPVLDSLTDSTGMSLRYATYNGTPPPYLLKLMSAGNRRGQATPLAHE